MRTLGSALLIIAALLLAAVTGPAIWAERNIVDEAGFVKLAGSLGANTEFQNGLAAVVATQTGAQIDIPAPLQNIAAGLINSAARSLSSNPGYADAWTETLRRSHSLTFEAAGNASVEGDLRLDIAPMIALVSDKVSSDIGVKLPTPPQVLISLEQGTVAKVLPLVTTLGAWSGWMAFIAVDLFVLGVIVARRRTLTVILAGLGLAGVALAWVLGRDWVVGIFESMSSDTDMAKQFGIQLGQLAQASWQWGITATFVLAGVLVAAGVVARIVGRTRTT